MNSDINLATLIIERLSSDTAKPFLMDASRTLSRTAFLEAVAARQEQLTRRFGDDIGRIVISGGHGIQGWIDAVAVWGIGGTAVPLGISVAPEQVPYIVQTSDPSCILGTHPALDPDATGINAPLLGLPEDSAAMQDRVSGRSADIASIVFTSGSTGNPKGVALSHAALAGNAFSTQKALATADDDRLFMAIPFNFISAISHFLVMAISGAELYATEQRLMATDFFDALGESGANAFGGSPMQIRWIAERAGNAPSALRWAMSSGDHLPVDVIKAFGKRLPDARLFTVYGMTELAGRFCYLPPDNLATHAGSVGMPIDGLKAQVLDDEMNPAAPGVVGEVYAGGDFLMDAYFGNPDATHDTLTQAGVRTGDLGFIDEDGFLFLIGRADDVFKCNGEKVSAIPIAQAMMETGLFADVAVVGVDDSLYGSVPHAFYVLKENTAFDKRTVIQTLRRKIPSSHIPRHFAPLVAIPRTGSGKVRRAELRRQAMVS